MLESVQVRLEIVKTLLTQAHFFQLEPAGASITEVAEPLVDWILTGSSVDADRVNPIGAAARQDFIQFLARHVPILCQHYLPTTAVFTPPAAQAADAFAWG